jgi:hypothetical protein
MTDQLILDRFRQALQPANEVEVSNARHFVKKRRKKLTALNIVNEIIKARHDNYSVYWQRGFSND